MSAAAKFLIGIISGIGALVLILATTFVALDEMGRLKAPAFANRLTFDEKLRHLRGQEIDDPAVLFIGSSTTLHGLDGAVLREQMHLDGDVLNLGVQDLRLNQSRFLAEFFLSVYDHAEKVIMVSTLLDVKECESTRADFFDPETVRGYLQGDLPPLYYQFKYLDLKGVLTRARQMPHLRHTDEDLESVSFDPYGSLLLEVPRERINARVWRGDPITLDMTCYRQLRALAQELADADIQFIYVIAPMRPGYLAEQDPDGTLLARHRRAVAEHLTGTGAIVIDAHAALDMPEDAFFDAYHLNREEARGLTRYVGQQMTARLNGAKATAGVRPTGLGAAPETPGDHSPSG